MAAVRPSRDVGIVSNQEIQNTSLRALVDEYVAEFRYGPPSTYRGKRYDLDQFLDFLAQAYDKTQDELRFTDATESSIRSYREFLLAQYDAPATAARKLSTIKHFFATRSAAHLVVDPARTIALPPPPPLEFKGLLDHQYESLMAVADRLEPRDRFWIKFLVGTGLRRQEACNLKLGQISSDWKMLEGVVGKRNKIRNVPITFASRQELMRYMSWRYECPTFPDSPLLVTGRSDTNPIDAKTLYRCVVDACLTAGIPRDIATPHKLRHTFARRTLAALSEKLGDGRALRVLAQILGHSDIKVTMTYTETERNELCDLVEDIA